MRAAGTTNSNSNMVSRQILTSELSAFLIEGRREHQVAMILILIDICLE